MRPKTEPSSPQKVEVSYDAARRVVIAHPRWTLTTAADVQAWLQDWKDALKPYPPKSDIVVILDDFHVRGEAFTAWGEARAELTKNYFGVSFRVNIEPLVRAAALTSGVLYNSVTAEAPTVEAAIEGILAARTRAADST